DRAQWLGRVERHFDHGDAGRDQRLADRDSLGRGDAAEDSDDVTVVHGKGSSGGGAGGLEAGQGGFGGVDDAGPGAQRSEGLGIEGAQPSAADERDFGIGDPIALAADLGPDEEPRKEAGTPGGRATREQGGSADLEDRR